MNQYNPDENDYLEPRFGINANRSQGRSAQFASDQQRLDSADTRHAPEAGYHLQQGQQAQQEQAAYNEWSARLNYTYSADAQFPTSGSDPSTSSFDGTYSSPAYLPHLEIMQRIQQSSYRPDYLSPQSTFETSTPGSVVPKVESSEEFDAPSSREQTSASAEVEETELATGEISAKRRRRSKQLPMAPPVGSVITEKSCIRCRVRKVKCDRTFPVCTNCKERDEECDLITLHPKDKQSSTARDVAESERIARLENRLVELELMLSEASAEWKCEQCGHLNQTSAPH